MTTQERISQQVYASYTDEELVRQIRSEQSMRDAGYHPEVLDVKKRGMNPDTCNIIIKELKFELDRRMRVK